MGWGKGIRVRVRVRVRLRIRVRVAVRILIPTLPLEKAAGNVPMMVSIYRVRSSLTLTLTPEVRVMCASIPL